METAIIFNVITLLGGVGMFLYGMSLMGSSLEKLAGGKLEKVLERLTTSDKKGVGAIKGWSLGLGVTAIIQSSAATTIMLIGFVNAGIMTLMQAIPVVFGANVGSTATAILLSLEDLKSGAGGSSVILQFISPTTFAPIFIGIGAFIMMFAKNKTAKDASGIFVGLGILFVGMKNMENVFEPLRDSEKVIHMFSTLSNPLYGVLLGLVITAIIQSSSASVGILQALAATTGMAPAVAFPVIVGQNIGKCMTILLGGLGANKKAKRVSFSYLFFNVFGAVFWMIVVYILVFIFKPDFWVTKYENRTFIAAIHIAFNFLTSLMMLPFSSQMANLTGKIIGKDEESKSDSEFKKLDDMLLNTPTIALEQCEKVMNSMVETVYENYKIAMELFEKSDEAKVEILNENESFIDKCETVLSRYTLKVNTKRLTKDERRVVSKILNSISDFERIGDRCINIYFSGEAKNEKGIHFSEEGIKEAKAIIEAVDTLLSVTMESFRNNDTVLAARIEPMKRAVGKMADTIKDQHIERLETGRCNVEAGIALLDLVGNIERMASHCGNVALHIVKRVNSYDEFDDMHGHAMDRRSEEYKALYQYYLNQFVDPIKNSNP
ncbi:MAG: Na/Pi cotransporter family protein [Lachnospiraceae bacterium]|nr:Na/Pi cotransporter family protein [Lachnospiraceae bacterium]